MATQDIKSKQIYDATGNMISNLHLQKGILTKEEMHCLLSILDLVVMGKRDPGLTKLLREWLASDLNTEIHEIVKATLLSIDFSDNKSIQRNMEIIQDLIRYNNKLKDS